MRIVAEFRRVARECKRLALKLANPADCLALELMATGWEKAAKDREAMLRSEEHSEPPTST